MSKRVSVLVVLLVSLVLRGPSLGVGASPPPLAPTPPTAWFDAAGAHLDGVTLRLAALGRGDARADLAPVVPTDDGMRVQYRRADATEWYVRQAGGGIEQGVTLTTRPDGDGSLTLTVATPAAIPLVDADGAGATLILPHGGQWRDDGLHVTDATGQDVPARFVGDTGGVRIVVEDAGAVYPLVVDPFVYAQTLAVSGTSYFGASVALSGDGSTALVGATSTNSGAGTAYVFTRGSGGYSQFGPTLAVSGTSDFGIAVALSGDGSTALVGAYGTNSNAGTAYVFTRGAGGYSQFGPTLAVSGTIQFGIAVALSGDGSTALIGAQGTNSNAGTAYVFTGGTGGYSQFGPTLAVSGTGLFGYRVALSADGSTALIGAPTTNSQAGTAYAFTRGASGYSQFGPTFAIGGATNFGSAVALSADGSTALVGADATNSAAGTAYTYTRVPGGYVQFGPTLAVSGTRLFGNAVALSGDGSTALVGADETNSNVGTAYAYTRGSGGYTLGSTLAVSGTTYFGVSVALSGDGNTALVGATGTNSYAGTAYVYATPASVSVLSGDHQSAVLGQQFASPLAAVVRDEDGNPLAGVTVVFLDPGGTGVPTATLSSTTAVTNSDGIARVTATAAGRPGTFTVSAFVSFTIPPASFTLTNTPAPTTVTLTGFSPPSDPTSGGTTVTIHGTNFAVPAMVAIGGVAATNVTVVSSTTITATAPAAASAGTVDIAVSTNGQTATIHGFTYLGSGSVAAQPGNHAPAGGGGGGAMPMGQPQRHDNAGSGGGSGGSGGSGAGPNAAPPPGVTPLPQPMRK